ncbi:TonB dependent receptor [compost metagenome]
MLRTSNDLHAPGYTLMNLGATYDTVVGGYDTTFRVALNNATGKQYWMYQYANYIKAGDPRSLNVSATLRF